MCALGVSPFCRDCRGCCELQNLAHMRRLGSDIGLAVSREAGSQVALENGKLLCGLGVGPQVVPKGSRLSCPKRVGAPQPPDELVVDIRDRTQQHGVPHAIGAEHESVHDAGMVDRVIGEEAQAEIVAPHGNAAEVVRPDQVDGGLDGVDPEGPEGTEHGQQATVNGANGWVLPSKVALHRLGSTRVPLAALGEPSTTAGAPPEDAA